MRERDFVEHVVWDTKSIVDVAIDASVEVLRLEGNVSSETLRRVGQNFSGVSGKPFELLNICEPENETPLLTFIPPYEFRIIDDNVMDKPPAEARLIIYNPLSDESLDYKVNQMLYALSSKLEEISDSYHLNHSDMELTFPKNYYAKNISRYVIPVLNSKEF